ncbi:hypothetical protein IAU60_004803 [Kwoniella sp. DSM 27419]
MSDTRSDAENQLHSIEMSADLEDSLGSALESSFNLPPPPPAPKKAADSPQEPTAIPAETVAASQEPVEGMDTWKETYESYLSEWQAESSLARSKAELTRKKIEEDKAARAKAEKDKAAADKKAKADAEKAEKDKIRLQLELESQSSRVGGVRESGATKAAREQKVKEAWEMVKGSKGSADQKAGETVETDGRGTTTQDVEPAQSSSAVKPLAYDPTTSTDPIPPVFQDAKPVDRAPVPTESVTQSRHSATSQAWEEISGPSGSSGTGSAEAVSPARSEGSEGDIVNVPSNPEKQDAVVAGSGSQHPQPPAQPPSLTLSLFSSPSSLSVSRILAVVGINLVLPFINGVFLGFGEIFAREAVRVGKAVWSGQRSLFGFGRGAAAGQGGRGTSGVGLSGGF